MGRRKNVFIMVLCLIIAVSFCFTVPCMAQERDAGSAGKQLKSGSAVLLEAAEAAQIDCLPGDQKSMSGHEIMSGKKVYWVKSGKVYHCTKKCRTLSRSKKIYSGTVKQAKKAGKKRPCKVCY